MARRRRIPGFTFLELLVVISILTLLSAAIIPLYGASVRAMQRRSVRGDFVATLYYLQELSIHQSRELRLLIDSRAGTYHAEGWSAGVGGASRFEPLNDRELGTIHSFPESLAVRSIKARRDRTTNQHYIGFYPDGSCDPAEVHFGPWQGGPTSFTVETTGALGEVQVSP